MNIQLFKNPKYFYKNIYELENQRSIDIYKINNGKIAGINLYYPNVLIKDDTNLILPLLERTMSLKSGTIYEKNDMKYEYSERELYQEYNNPLFFFVYNTDNYFHFLYDTLPYLISYLHLKKEIPELKLLMQYPNEQKTVFYPFVLEFLQILSIDSYDIVLINENIVYSEIYISTSYTHDIDSNLPPRKEIYSFYQDIVKNVRSQYEEKVYKTPKKIYVSRRTHLHNDFSNIGTNYTTRRKLVNEDELLEKLLGVGYTEVFTENLTTIEKIIYFSNATHVVGAIGGGISNVLFSPKTTKLEAIVSPTFLDVNSRFKYSLNCVDVYYNYNAESVEKGELKTYMRVKTKDGKMVGEIEKIYDKTLVLSYTDGSNTGWNAQNEYRKIEIDINDIERLDNGLNSPWILYL